MLGILYYLEVLDFVVTHPKLSRSCAEIQLHNVNKVMQSVTKSPLKFENYCVILSK
jgi:hypothetical protein